MSEQHGPGHSFIIDALDSDKWVTIQDSNLTNGTPIVVGRPVSDSAEHLLWDLTPYFTTTSDLEHLQYGSLQGIRGARIQLRSLLCRFHVAMSAGAIAAPVFLVVYVAFFRMKREMAADTYEAPLMSELMDSFSDPITCYQRNRRLGPHGKYKFYKWLRIRLTPQRPVMQVNIGKVWKPGFRPIVEYNDTPDTLVGGGSSVFTARNYRWYVLIYSDKLASTEYVQVDQVQAKKTWYDV